MCKYRGHTEHRITVLQLDTWPPCSPVHLFTYEIYLARAWDGLALHVGISLLYFHAIMQGTNVYVTYLEFFSIVQHHRFNLTGGHV